MLCMSHMQKLEERGKYICFHFLSSRPTTTKVWLEKKPIEGQEEEGEDEEDGDDEGREEGEEDEEEKDEEEEIIPPLKPNRAEMPTENTATVMTKTTVAPLQTQSPFTSTVAPSKTSRRTPTGNVSLHQSSGLFRLLLYSAEFHFFFVALEPCNNLSLSVHSFHFTSVN